MEIHRIVAEPVPATARQHMVRMRDGVRLATDVYPAANADGPLPAVLVRLPYDKNSRYVFMDRVAERFTARGYVLVVQDVRGKFRSEGETLAWTGEVNDGYDTIEWIVNQDWSNGVVGMFGDSYYGFTQWSAVASEHPALRAIVPRVTATSIAPGRESMGDPSIRRVPWLESAGYLASFWTDNDGYEFETDLSDRPLAAMFEEVFEAIGARSKAFDLMVPHGIELDAYNARHPYDARPVPVLHCVGWFDNLCAAHMWDYAQLSLRPGWDAVQYLHADASDHENTLLEDAPLSADADFAVDDAALERMLDGYTGPALDFFDVFLKGVAGVRTLPRVRWKLGHVGWRTAEQWPPAGARSSELHLADLDSATGAAPGGRLADQALSSAHSVQWRYDPDDLVPSAVLNTFDFLRTYPDERATADREDVLVFTGGPDEQAVDLAGPVQLRLDVSSTAPTFDVFAKLFDVAPDGSAHMIVRGEAQGGAQGEAAGVLRLDLGHVGYRLRPGHRFALTVTSSDFPLYVPNSGSAENPWLTRAPKPSTQTLRSGVLSITVLP